MLGQQRFRSNFPCRANYLPQSATCGDVITETMGCPIRAERGPHPLAGRQYAIESGHDEFCDRVPQEVLFVELPRVSTASQSFTFPRAANHCRAPRIEWSPASEFEITIRVKENESDRQRRERTLFRKSSIVPDSYRVHAKHDAGNLSHPGKMISVSLSAQGGIQVCFRLHKDMFIKEIQGDTGGRICVSNRFEMFQTGAN